MPEFPTFQPFNDVADSVVVQNANMFDRIRRRKTEAIQLAQQATLFEQSVATNRANIQEANIRLGKLQSQLDQQEKLNDLRISQMGSEAAERQRIYDLRSEWNKTGLVDFRNDIASLQGATIQEQQKKLPEIQLKYAKYAELQDAAGVMGESLNRAGGLAMAQFAKAVENSNVEQALKVSDAEMRGYAYDSVEDMQKTHGAVSYQVAKDVTGKTRVIANPTAVDPRADQLAFFKVLTAQQEAVAQGVGPDGRPTKVDFKSLLADPEVAAVLRVPGSRTATAINQLLVQAQRQTIPRQKSAQTIEAESASQEMDVVARDLRHMINDPVVREKITGRIGPIDNMLAKAGNMLGVDRDADVVKFEQRFASIRNIILKARSGGAVTESEAARFLEEMGSFSESDYNFAVRFEAFLGDLERTLKSKLAAFGAKDAADSAAFQQRGVTETSTDAL